MAAKTAKKARHSSLSATGQVIASEEGDLRAERIQGALPLLSNKNAKRIKAEILLSDLFDGQGWGHNISNGNLLRAAKKGIVAAESGYEIPSGGTLGAADYQQGHATDSTARFKLATEYKGVAMWDGESGEWRVVVDLEWSKSKIPGISYGNKKGWLLVCELMPGHQDNLITAAEDKTEILVAYINNEAIYVGIIAAGNAQTRPVIKKT
jgi:hypothetical protein